MPNIRLALRTLFKSPFITLVAILSLALGIGANSAIFSLYDQMIMRSLPVPNPDELVNFKSPGPKPGSNSCGQAGSCDEIFSYPMFKDLEKAQTSFTGIAAHRNFGGSLGYQGTSLAGSGLVVSGSYFPVLGLTPALGRLLTPEDDKTVGTHFVVVLAHDYWRTRFNLNPNVLNETLVVNGQAMTIVGVAPEGFNGTTLGDKPDVFVPLTMRGLMQPGFRGFENRRQYWAYLFARLKPGVSIEEATTAINGPYHAIVNDVEAPLQQGMSDERMKQFRAKLITTEPGDRGQSGFDDDARAPLLILLAVTSTVLLIACANIANLLLVRGAGRAAEMAVRLSIGATRRQLITQLLTESILLAAFGAVAGMFVAAWTLNLIATFMPAEDGNIISFELSTTMVVFAAITALATGIVFGLFPALHSTRQDLASTLKNQAGQPGGAKAARRFRTTLATVQIAMSMALLVPAGLFAKSLFNISRVDLGIQTDHMMLFSIAPELNSYTTERTRQLFERMEDELAAVPGVTSVVATIVPVLAGDNWGNSLGVEGFEAGPDTNTNASFNGVGPGYFKTMGVPLMMGREFTRSDAFGTPKVAIVNQAFVKKFNLGDNPLGKRFGLGGGAGSKMDIEIVGVAQDAKYSDVKDAVPPQYYLPYRQEERLGYGYFYVRTATPPEQMLSTIPAVMRKLDASLPLGDVKTMETQIAENVTQDRIISTLSLSFALLATILAAIGLYGVLAYTVAQRTREFGLRMALGADGSAVRGMVMKQVAMMAAIGGLIGLAAAIGIGRLAQSLLFEMEGTDPFVLAGATFALAVVAIGAGFIPALRASRIDPMNALRYE
jgi:predicted permease